MFHDYSPQSLANCQVLTLPDLPTPTTLEADLASRQEVDDLYNQVFFEASAEDLELLCQILQAQNQAIGRAYRLLN